MIEYYGCRNFKPDEIFFAAARGMGIKHPVYSVSLSLEENLHVAFQVQEMNREVEAKIKTFFDWLDSYAERRADEIMQAERIAAKRSKKGLFSRLKDLAIA